jgi:hypothetical protein
MSVTMPRVVACSWCGLLSELGPVCSVCGSPVLDVTGRTTVLTVSWPLQDSLVPLAQSERVAHQWVTLGQVSEIFRIPEPSLRSLLAKAPLGDEPHLLLIEPGTQAPPSAIWTAREPLAPSVPHRPPPLMPDPPPFDLVPAPATSDRAPSAPSLWVASVPAPTPFRLEAAWAFQPTELERRVVRMEMLRARGATLLAMGIGAAGVVYLVDHALR